MNILITGGLGFIGINTALRFSKNLSNQIFIIDNLDKILSIENISLIKDKSNITFIKSDLRNLSDLTYIFETNTFDVIFHLAAQTAVTLSVNNPLKDFESNVVATFNLLECTRKYSKNAKFIFSSTNKVYSTDYKREKHFDDKMTDYFFELDYSISNIFDLSTFPVKSVETVMCCEVLEHLVDYKTAFKNLLKLTEKRLIIGVPWRRSFFMPGDPPIGHCNFWDDKETEVYKSIYEFESMCKPHKFFTEKILTKPEDKMMGQKSYICIIDKS